ncbi:Yip1 family protein [Draconibacterium halophilum]|uniref:YIP1 family protein n=1 Tax=Draconibacterium halophilum TaxID=2706887 RepID=A0A6C0RHD2_9BACT|nr:Yip1 family protein [Draconibacterium halophilum]QIA08943.1 YIP1 family protein [Draconibacterium halophilum]
MEFSFSKLIGEVKFIIVNPKGFWVEQKETADDQKLWLTYLLPIALAGAVAVFIGEFFQRSDFFVQFPLFKASREVLLFVLQYFISVFFTKELMKTFGTEKNVDVARKLVVYSMTPMLLVSVITGLFPFLYVVDIIGMYSFYLFWIGAKELLTFPDGKEHSYILITIVVNFFIFSFLSIFLSKLLLSF